MEKPDLICQVARAQAGDTAAFDTLVRRFQNPAVLYARSLLRFDRAAAEDAAQEAFVQAWHDLPTLTTPAAFPAWLRRIVFKHADRVRRRGTIATIPLDAAFHVGGGTEPWRAAEATEDAATLRRALESLPEREREAALLYYRDDLDLAEIASFLGVPRTTVKNRLHAARKRLRRELWEMAEEILEREKPSQDDAFSGAVLTRVAEEFRRQMKADPHTADRKLLAEGQKTLDAALAMPGPLDAETVRAGFYVLGRQDERLQIVSLLMRYLAQPLDDSQTAWAYYELICHAAWGGSAAAAVLAFEAFDRWLPGKNPRLSRDSHEPVGDASDASEPFYYGSDEIRMLLLGMSAEFARAWRGVWREDDYLTMVDDLLRRVVPVDRNRQLRFSMMRMACAACETSERLERARDFVNSMYALAGESPDEEDRVRWQAKALGHDMNLRTHARDATGATKKAQEWAELLRSAHGDWVRGERHDLACQFVWQGRQALALPLFEQNLQSGGHANAWGYLMHAAAVWEQTHDRRRTLELIRDGAARGKVDMTPDFRRQTDFAEVHDDPEFLAAVQKPG